MLGTLQPWVGKASVLSPSQVHSTGSPSTKTSCPHAHLWQGRGEMGCRLGLRGSLLSPKPTAQGQPQAAREAVGAAWPGSTSTGLPMRGQGGCGCSGRVKAFQTEIPQQKAGSALELKSKC